jgi:8-amino-7-oxononanoate synthase
MSVVLNLERRIAAHLAELETEGLLRVRRPPAGIDLCSNDYLGLANHPAIKERMAQAVLVEGCGATGSRLLRGERESFVAIECRFAGFKGTEAALYFATGYAANLGVLGTFLEEGDVVFSDELNHASLIDGMRLARAQRVIFPHNDAKYLERLLRTAHCAGQKYLVTESVFSMEGDFAPLADYAALCRKTGTALIVDEAHGVGVFGDRGSGLIEAAGVDDAVFLSINTAGKALGVCGGFVCGSETAIQYLSQRARTLVFSTAPPPAMAAAIDESLNVIEREPDRRARVLERALLLRELLVRNGLPVLPGGSQIIPVILGESDRAVAVAAALQADGFDVRAIRPPTVPPGTARLRISINANLDAGAIERFAEALSRHAACHVGY